MKAARASLAVVLGLTGPAVAGTCGEPGFRAALAALRADGWTVARELTDAQRDALAWTRAITYIQGDDGGWTQADILALQRRAAPGLLRRVDTDTTRSVVLTRGPEAMTLTETVTAPGLTERRCRFATMAPLPGVAPIDTAGWPGAPALTDLTFTFPEETEE